jgi:hypothetical protein
MMEMSPCNGCTERYTACHDHCDKHKKWLDRYRAQQKHLNDHKGAWCIPTSVAREKNRTQYIKKPTKGRKGGEQ